MASTTMSSSQRQQQQHEQCERFPPHVFPTSDLLGVSLGEFVALAARDAVRDRGRFVVAVAGGSLPKLLAASLALLKRDEVDWSRWDVWMVDERHVPLDDADSNYKAVLDALAASHVEIPAENVHPLNPHVSVQQAAGQYEELFTKTVDRFDLVMLGMGPDGHVASLFPGHALLAETKSKVAFIEDSPKPPPRRITFTFPVINNARACAFVVTGESKAQVVAQSIHPPEGIAKLPAAMVEPTNGSLHWFLDAAAASKL